MALTTFAETQLLTWLIGGTVTPPAGLFLGLFTAPPDASGAGGTEVSGNGYTRVAAPLTLTPSSTPAQIANAAAVTFPDATASWGTVTHAGLFDAATGGNLWAVTPIAAPGTQTPTPVTINTGQGFRTNPGQLTVTLT